MLDHFSIFTRGGLVLWTFQLTALKGSPIEALIQTCLLQERSGETSFNYGKNSASYTLKWTFHNELGLVFVAVYQRMLQLLYVDQLLAAVKKQFSEIYSPKIACYPGFKDTFQQLLLEAEEHAKEMKRPKQATDFQLTKKGQQIQKMTGGGGGSKKAGKGAKPANASVPAGGEAEDGSDADGSSDDLGNDGSKENENPSGNQIELSAASTKQDGAFDVSKLKARRGKSKGQPAAKKGGGLLGMMRDLDVKEKESKEAKGSEIEKKKKSGRGMRKWDDEEEGATDLSDPSEPEPEIEALDVKKVGQSLMDKDYDDDDDDEEEEEEEEWEAEEGSKSAMRSSKGEASRASTAASSAKSSWLSSVFQSMAGKASLEPADVQPALKALKERLMTKNVAEEIAEKLCRSVESSLVGKKQSSFTRISSVVQTAMEEALVRLLSPKRSVDILRDVLAAKEEGRPFVICFVGVNGVGKSTNLAKVAYWLRQHDISVMLAACDTFRAGAVEQLRTHARRLQVPLFERGYEKDPAVVAREAIKEAARMNLDAVLVDTAGRMQDNEPLMRALAKLINTNNPDLVLFVGEALVGNDAVDQLSKFNERLADLSTSSEPNAIDGVLLTKFDTIDDKVGAALSMVYISGAPIMFVGCGQTYTDLKRLNVKEIVKTLLK